MRRGARSNAFDTDELTRQDPKSYYALDNQKDAFKHYFGNDITNALFATRNGRQQLERGHFTPYADFMMESWQYATNKYLNVVPQWGSINGGNWGTIEAKVKRKASRLRDDLLVFTGAHGVMTARNNGHFISVYLDKSHKHFPVPEWNWKIVKHQRSNSAIALVTLNSPIAHIGNWKFIEKDLCHNLCNGAHSPWNIPDRLDFAKGYTICCSVKDLMAAVEGIPLIADARNILTEHWNEIRPQDMKLDKKPEYWLKPEIQNDDYWFIIISNESHENK